MQDYPALHRLVCLLESLRDKENGCPWDLAQDFNSLTPYTIEEVYELVEAIDEQDPSKIEKELGDVLFHLVFYAQLGKEKKWFDLEQIADTISQKMISRHPHVFNQHQKMGKHREVKVLEETWYQQKQQEELKTENESWMDSVSSGLPGFIRAKKLQKQAARIGFDFAQPKDVLNKLKEEINELEDALDKGDSSSIEDEFGDVLFTCVNLSRHIACDSETSLRQSSIKFSNRFKRLEEKFNYNHSIMKATDIAELEKIWQKLK